LAEAFSQQLKVHSTQSAKFELPLSTPLRHSDMDLSFPIAVIGKVALSIHY
jgi:hypothetical protein